MEASVSSSLLATFPTSNPLFSIKSNCSKPHVSFISTKRRSNLVRKQRKTVKISAINDASVLANTTSAQVTWQIIVGSIAGVIPFLVAGIEFSKRIIAQRRCEVCGGSGLVLRDNGYFKCPGCGGFLPWQSWRRFFSG